MIEVKNLTKIYSGSEKQKKALDNVSFKLPDKGLIFIIGKSGSGKSTLINMLGALDDATSGEVLIDNKDIIKMKQDELDLYRNQYLGIIYQNYNLFENETVIDNIKIALELNPKKEKDSEALKRINDLLDSIDLSTEKEKVVMNMSGGQKQRVAIARALIKSPKLILADEPTGNLDSKTTNIIFDLLKKLSEDTLIVVISHDNKSATKYADRILEISDGKIVSDKVRNTRYKEEVVDGKLTNIYSDKKLEDKDIKAINTRLEDTDFRVYNSEERFVKTKEEDIVYESKTMDIKKDFSNLKSGFRTFWIFLKNSISSLIATVLLSIFIISILSLSLSFSQFDGKIAIRDIKEKYTTSKFIIKKGFSYTNNKNNIEKGYSIKIDEEDDQKIKEIYNGQLLPIYTVPVDISVDVLDNGKTVGDSNFSGLYCNSSLGVVIANSEYLENTIGLDVIAGSLYNIANSNDLIITDYLADSLVSFVPDLKSNDPNDPYQKLLDDEYFDEVLTKRYSIGAIVNTNYKTRYKTLIDGYKEANANPSRSQEIVGEIIASDLYTTFHDEFYSTLGYAYTLNNNYIENYINNAEYAVYRNAYMYFDNDFNNPVATMTNYYVFVDKDLKENEIKVSSAAYSALTKLKSEDALGGDEEKTNVIISNYGFDQTTADTPLDLSTLEVVGSHSGAATIIYASKEYVETIKKDQVFKCGYIVTDEKYAVDLTRTMKQSYFYAETFVYSSLDTLMNMTEMFSSIFLIIVIFLIAILVVVVLSHNLRIIKHERYRIGIYKALGCSNAILNLAIFIYSLFTVALIFAFSITSAYFLSNFADALLRFSFCKFLNNNIYNDISLISYNFYYLLGFNVVIFFFTIVSSFIPFARIKRIKPNEILRKVDE